MKFMSTWSVRPGKAAEVIAKFLSVYARCELNGSDRGENAAKCHPPYPHLLVTHIVMPGTSAPELARQLTVLQPDMAVAPFRHSRTCCAS